MLGRFRLHSALTLAAILVTLLAGCMPSAQLGARPAGSTLDAVEAYLRRYQPGIEPRLFQTSRIYDRNGTFLAERWEEGRRTWVGLDRISGTSH